MLKQQMPLAKKLFIFVTTAFSPMICVAQHFQYDGREVHDINFRSSANVWLSQGVDLSIFSYQKKLSSLGFNPGQADGKIGKKTSLAIKEFQSKYELATNGYLDIFTRRKIDALLGTDPYGGFTEEEIEWAMYNAEEGLNVSSLHDRNEVYQLVYREGYILTYLQSRNYLYSGLGIRNNNWKSEIALLTTEGKIKNRMKNAIDSIAIEDSYNTGNENAIEVRYSFLGWYCSFVCEGHYLGYRWGAINGASESAQCLNQSPSFERGCNLFVSGH